MSKWRTFKDDDDDKSEDDKKDQDDDEDSLDTILKEKSKLKE